MRNIIVSNIAFLCCFVGLFAQNDSKYFPQEEIIISECESSNNKSDCFFTYLKNKVLDFLRDSKKTASFLEFDKDTLTIGVSLAFNSDNHIRDRKSWTSLHDEKLDKKYGKEFETIFKKLDIVQIINRKPKPLVSHHSLSFQLVLKKNEKSIDFEFIDNTVTYSGGVINEVPRFPGCENLNDDEARTCFQEKIQEHIRVHFRYPSEAMEKGVSGTVSTLFIINKEGKIENIKTRGHPLLEEEVLRIIKLLPVMSPGMQNGRPVKVPYSMPIGFSLN